jgi:hypothetical protein
MQVELKNVFHLWTELLQWLQDYLHTDDPVINRMQPTLGSPLVATLALIVHGWDTHHSHVQIIVQVCGLRHV